MTATARTTGAGNRAARTAGPGEILVPIGGELVPRRLRQAEFDTFRGRGGASLSAWSANQVAGMALGRTQGAEAVELWAHADGRTPGFVLLVRFTRKTRGMVPHAEVVGAARTGRSDAVQEDPESEGPGE